MENLTSRPLPAPQFGMELSRKRKIAALGIGSLLALGGAGYGVMHHLTSGRVQQALTANANDVFDPTCATRAADEPPAPDLEPGQPPAEGRMRRGLDRLRQAGQHAREAVGQLRESDRTLREAGSDALARTRERAAGAVENVRDRAHCALLGQVNAHTMDTLRREMNHGAWQVDGRLNAYRADGGIIVLKMNKDAFERGLVRGAFDKLRNGYNLVLQGNVLDTLTPKSAQFWREIPTVTVMIEDNGAGAGQVLSATGPVPRGQRPAETVENWLGQLTR